ncbi:hypothetical protein FRB94_001390 [Tulasnella sp. JGI-2019a]|nr:hypothetical protein FRB93_013525 [Tulasnella sp. JGI-2019a]KAG9005606.1 hypothetical protein FRB94_001390 [Tulasnella sp. JGI-2019a]
MPNQSPQEIVNQEMGAVLEDMYVWKWDNNLEESGVVESRRGFCAVHDELREQNT